MIKWTKIQIDRELDLNELSIDIDSEIEQLRHLKPILVTWKDGSREYTIPCSIGENNYIFHSDVEEAYLYNYLGICDFVWYGELAKSKEEWKDPEWRKRAEIKLFL